MTRIPYNPTADDTAADRIVRAIAAIPTPLVILAAVAIGLPLGWTAAA